MKTLVDYLRQARPTLKVGNELWSWQALSSKVARCLEHFSMLGLQQGDIVAASGSKASLVISWLACLEGGYIFCPVPIGAKDLHPEPLEQFAHSLKTTSSRAVLWLSQAPTPLLSRKNLCEWEFLSQVSRPCALLKTSGSGDGTGRWVALDQDHVIRQIQAHSAAMAPHSGFHRLQILPLYHVFGLILDLSVGLYLGQQVELIESKEFLGERWIKKESWPYDMALTPRLLHLFHRFYQGPKNALVHVGGARVSAKLLQRAQDCFQTVIEGYGLTECGPGVLFNGLAIDCEIDMQPLACEVDALNSLGLLKVKSPTMGFWQGRESSFENGWYDTRDLAMKDASGRYQIIGRLDRALKHFDGRWILLDELENHFERHFGLSGLHMGLKSDGKLHLAILEEDQAMRPLLERAISKFFDLPLHWQIAGLEELIQKPHKRLLQTSA